MNRFSCLSLLVLIAHSALAAPTWHWTDYEIIGQKRFTREQIAARIPITLGTPFVPNQEQWDRICAGIQKNFGFGLTKCSALRWFDGRTWFVVDVVEKEDLAHLVYRDIPRASVAWGDVHMPELLTRFLARQQDLFSQQHPVNEFVVGDYVDYDDPVMHELVMQLRTLAHLHRANLINIIARDQDETKRSQACWLLYWAGSPELSIAQTMNFLFDPSASVRNDLPRFMLHWTGSLQNQSLRIALAERFAKLITYPSDTDRNKGLFALVPLVEKFPQDRQIIARFAMAPVSYIAHLSVIDNVGGIARQLMQDFQATR